MPCAAHPRGFNDVQLPALPSISNDPCAKPIVATVNGVDVSAEALCLPHWEAVHGLAAVKGAITFGA